MELWQFLVIFTVGVVAGVINTLAGGGSLITLPVFIFLFIGVYGGFIQAGIGFLIIAVLTTISGLNLVETNSHKVYREH